MTGILQTPSNFTVEPNSANSFHIGGGGSYVWLDNRDAENTVQNSMVMYPDYTTIKKETRVPNLKINNKNIYPVGTCYITSTNTNPSELLGVGTWSLIDKNFTSSATNGSSFFTVNSTNATFSACYIKRMGHTINIRLSIKPKVTLGDSTVALGNFQFSALGITGLNATAYLLGASDGGGGICEATLNYESGLLNHLDTVHRSGSNTTITSTEYDVIYHFDIQATQGTMLDSFCNQFIWKRTA